jgi:hypothetical protein
MLAWGSGAQQGWIGLWDLRAALLVLMLTTADDAFWAASLKLRVGSNFPIVGYFAGTPAALTLGAVRNQVRLPVYARLDLRANRTFTFNQRRLTLFVEVMNVTGRRNLGQSVGTIHSNLTTDGFATRMIPRVPSAGFLIEF